MKKLFPYWPLLIIVFIIVTIISIHYYFISPVFSGIKSSVEQARSQKSNSGKEFKEITNEFASEAVKSIGKTILEEVTKPDPDKMYKPISFKSPEVQLGFLDLSIRASNRLNQSNLNGFGYSVKVELSDKFKTSGGTTYSFSSGGLIGKREYKATVLYTYLVTVISEKYEIDVRSAKYHLWEEDKNRYLPLGNNDIRPTDERNGIVVSILVPEDNVNNAFLFFNAKDRSQENSPWYRFYLNISEFINASTISM